LKEDLFVFVPGITGAIAAVRLGAGVQDLTVDPLEVQRVRIILDLVSKIGKKEKRDLFKRNGSKHIT
jgi:hypothetical protein